MIDHPARWALLPIGIGLIIIFIVVVSSPATLADPGSVVRWGYVKFSRDPVALFVIVVGFGTGLAAVLH